MHCPDALQMPVLAQDGEHLSDWMSVRLREPLALADGSWAKSGMASHTIMRVLAEVRAAHVLGATRNDPGGSVAEVWFADDGSCVNVAWPRNSDWGYDRTPGCKATVRGRDGGEDEGDDEFEKPEGSDRDAC